MEQGAENGQAAVEPVAATAPAASAVVKSKTRQKSFVGRVSSNKMTKTVVVRVEKVRRHRIYHRNIRYHVKYYAHDETNTCKQGDLVRIVETRPLSKLKRWKVAEVIERGGVDRAEV